MESDDSQDKDTEREQEAENEKEEETMFTPKPRVKQVAKKSKLDTTLGKTTKFCPFVSGVAKACFIDVLSKKKFIKERGLS